MKKHLWLAAAALLFSACATEPPAPPATADSAAQAIAAAEAAVKRADSVGFAWRDSEAMIADAKAAAEKQEYDRAVKLAKTAEKQGNLAYQQYLDQNPPPAQAQSQPPGGATAAKP